MPTLTIPDKKKAVKRTTTKKQSAIITPSTGNYNEFKTFDGQQYTGMKVGRSHKWYYDKGEWKERKITPDRWEITYSVIKRRAGKAPEGTGVPVGTGYHWFILSHQFVHKLNANDYSTAVVGIKLKLEHKRADKDKWNVSEATKRNRLIQMLEEFISELKADPNKTEIIELDITFKDKQYKGMAVPMIDSCSNGICREFDITLNDKHLGIIRCTKDGWRMTNVKPQALVNASGEEIFLWYE
jgi:hypothetical protein